MFRMCFWLLTRLLLVVSVVVAAAAAAAAATVVLVVVVVGGGGGWCCCCCGRLMLLLWPATFKNSAHVISSHPAFQLCLVFIQRTGAPHCSARRRVICRLLVAKETGLCRVTEGPGVLGILVRRVAGRTEEGQRCKGGGSGGAFLHWTNHRRPVGGIGELSEPKKKAGLGFTAPGLRAAAGFVDARHLKLEGAK